MGENKTLAIDTTTDTTTTASAPMDRVDATIQLAVDLLLPARWDAVLTIENELSGDNRIFDPDSLSHRELPLPLMLQTQTNEGHMGAEIAGSIDKLQRVGSEWHASGTFDLDGDAGKEAARLVAAKILRWVSVDVDMVKGEITLAGDNCDESTGEGCDIIRRYTQGRISGATIVAFPAFASAVIVPEGTPIAAATENGRTASAKQAVVAASTPAHPPASWFDNPAFTAPTPLTITADGRVFGHLAAKGCHTGYENICMTPPSSQSDYVYFRTGVVLAQCDDNCDAELVEIPTGVITMSTGHAEQSLGHRDAASHYDHSGAGVADVVVGEDEHGIWCAGAIRPGVTDEQLRTLRASSLSGDWRRIGGNLELIAVLVVNHPGFPVLREMPRAMVASGHQVSLVAAGIVPQPDPYAELSRRLELVESRLDTLTEPEAEPPFTLDTFLSLLKDLRSSPSPVS